MITAFFVWLSIIGTLGVKDDWDKNRGAEILDVGEINLIRKAEGALAGNKAGIDYLDEGWMSGVSKPRLKQQMKISSEGKRVGTSERNPAQGLDGDQSLSVP